MGIRWGQASVLVIALLQATALHAAPSGFDFSLPAQPLDAALKRYGAITGRELLYRSELVDGRSSSALHGRFEAADALTRLLAGTGLVARQLSANVLVIQKAQRSGQPASDQDVPPTSSESASPQITLAPPADQPAEIVVTGTNIRGATNPTAPVTSVSRLAIDRSGRTSVADVIATLPQSFGGQGTSQSMLSGSDRTGFNTTLASAPDLRGLGTGATLTLVNGRRTSGSGSRGDFTDLSLIPLAAVERIEVLTDGASAIYGSDAVAGVVNVIMRSDFRGSETRLTGGSTTQGGMGSLQLSETAGTTWNGGHVLVAYQYDRTGRLAAADRRATRSADLRPLGGSDWRSYYASPGTILSIDPQSGTFVPGYAIPASGDGHPAAGDFKPGSNLEGSNAQSDLQPAQTIHALYASASQTIMPGFTVYAEGRAARRRFDYRAAPYTSTLEITPANPNFVSPDGGPFDLIAYSFSRDLGPTRVDGQVTSLAGTLGTTFTPFRDWEVDAYGTIGSEHSRTRNSNFVNETSLAEALGNSPDDPSTPFSTSIDGYFNPFGSGQANSAAVLDFIGQGFSRRVTRSSIRTANIKADGPLFSVPGGTVRIAMGANVRREGLTSGETSFSSGTVPLVAPDETEHRTVGAVFAELAVPLVSPANAIPFARRIDLSLAIRHEHYSDFGNTTNPKLGIAWTPIDGLVLRTSWGTSFRAPSLPEIADPQQVVPLQLPNAGGGAVPILFLLGGNPGLQAEKARTLTAGFDSTPMARLHISGDYFRTRFTNRIGQPALQDILTALTDPALSNFVQAISPATNPEDLRQVEALLASPGAIDAGAFPPTAFQAIVDGRQVNTSAVLVQGLDASVDYSLPAWGGVAEFALASSYMLQFRENLTPSAPAIERAGRVGYPARLRLRSSIDWSKGRFDANLAGNLVTGSRDASSIVHPRVAPWFTLDARIAYQPADRDARGLRVSFSVQNLLDTAPPFADRPTGYGYDSANASVAGRIVSLEVSQRF